MLAVGWDLSGAVSQNSYRGPSIPPLPRLNWASSRHGSWVLRTRVLKGPSGGCSTFDDLITQPYITSGMDHKPTQFQEKGT